MSRQGFQFVVQIVNVLPSKGDTGKLKETDPEFWEELSKSTQTVSSELKGESEPDDGDGDDDGVVNDDSEVPTHAVVEHVVHNRLAKGVTVTETGALAPSAEAESAEPNAGGTAPTGTGCGRGSKCRGL